MGDHLVHQVCSSLKSISEETSLRGELLKIPINFLKLSQVVLDERLYAEVSIAYSVVVVTFATAIANFGLDAEEYEIVNE